MKALVLAGSEEDRGDCFSRSTWTHVPTKRKLKQDREPGWGQGVLGSKCAVGPSILPWFWLAPVRTSCEDIFPLGKTKDMELGATVIYFQEQVV